MVTGVAAILKAIKPELTPAQIKKILIETADPLSTSDPDELNKKLGSACNPGNRSDFRGCRLNALKAVQVIMGYTKIMWQVVKNIRAHHLIYLLAGGGLFFAALNLNPSTGGQPLFSNTNSFVLFSEKEITLEPETQISSGDLGSNNKLDIQKDNIINGNLFAKEISIDKNTTINGNASFNKLKLHKESQILGSQTKPVQLPIAQLPSIPAFPVGNENRIFTGTSSSNILLSGNYRNIILEKNSRLTFTGGIYNLRKLELKEKSILIYSASTTINIQFKLKGQQKTSILPGNNNLSATDLLIKYLGFRDKKDKDKEDDDNEINSELDNQERKDHKTGKIGRPILFGKDSFLNFKLLAPKANIKLGERTIFRGQILGRKINVGKNSILSLGDDFLKPPDSQKLVEEAGEIFVVNEIVVLLTPTSNLQEARKIADLVNGNITTVIEEIQLYKIEVNALTNNELESVIQLVESAQLPSLVAVGKNTVGGLR